MVHGRAGEPEGGSLATIAIAALIRTFAEFTTASDDGAALLSRFCDAMGEAGLPLWRVSVSMPALDAMASSFSIVWTEGAEVAVSRTAHGAEHQTPFLTSPINALLIENKDRGVWSGPEMRDARFPLLCELQEAGATEYVLHLVSFTPGTALRGVALSFATRRAGGFGEDGLAALDQLVPVFGLAMCKLALSHTLRRTLGTYLGEATGSEVLGGRITRGEGRTIWAVILLADLRGFTRLTDRSDPASVVGWLNEHFEAVGEPVTEHGGEILKFLGDGFIAVFPVMARECRPCADCERALGAALAAHKANVALNAHRAAAGLPQLEVDLVLHFGEVVYGNVGTRQRLDFTIIGKAVNEASRMEKYCGELDRAVLISDAFAERCHTDLVPVAVVPLRGLDQPQRVWTVPGLQ